MSKELETHEIDEYNKYVGEENLKKIERFVIDSDSKAEWALNKIRDEEKEMKRLVNICEEKISEYQMKIGQFKRQCENETSYFKAVLHGYFLTVPHKKSKTQEMYKLPSGKLKLKLNASGLSYNMENLVEWAEDNKRDELIKTTKAIKWKELKAELKVVGDSVVSADGEIISEITILKKDPEFVVEVG